MRRYLTMLVLVGVSVGVCAAQVSRGTAEVKINGKKIVIEYGRPELQGRDMLGKATVGMVWRMGADDATSLMSEGDLNFGNTRVKQGRYSLFAKKSGADQWELIFNSESKIWGTGRKSEKDLLSIPLESSRGQSSTEKFTIVLKSTGQDSGAFSMVWGTMELRAGSLKLQGWSSDLRNSSKSSFSAAVRLTFLRFSRSRKALS